jgi:hypothetical protein
MKAQLLALMMKTQLLASILVMFALSISCLFFPRAVQSYAVKTFRWKLTPRDEALKAYVASDRYFTLLRAVGLIALLGALLLAYTAFRGGGKRP